MSRPKSKIHRPNGPYLPVGDLGGEYCVKCRQPWPCPQAPQPAPETRIEITGNLIVHHPIKETAVEYAEWFNKEWEGVEKWRRDWNNPENSAAAAAPGTRGSDPGCTDRPRAHM